MLIFQIAFGIVLGYVLIKALQYTLYNFGAVFKTTLRILSSVLGIGFAVISIYLFLNKETSHVDSSLSYVLFALSAFLIGFGLFGKDGFMKFLENWD